jgi:hypothetical protein
MGVFTGSGSGSGSNLFGMVDEDERQRQALFNRIANYESRFENVGVETPAPKQESNLLLRALDILDRPRNAIVSGLAGKGFVKGLTGESHVNVSDLLEDVDNKYLRAGLGFIGDVLLDPLTYVTLGAAGAARGAATQGARKFLKFAGQPIADVTPVAEGLGKALQATKLPEMLGPVFSNRYIRRSVTSDEELPDVAKALDLTRSTQRLIHGQQQDALDELKGLYAGMSPEAAAQASAIIEAPTLVRRQASQTAIGTPRPRVTVGRPGRPATLSDIVTPAVTGTSKAPSVPSLEDALSALRPGRVAGVRTTVEVPGLRVKGQQAFEARPAASAVENASPSVPVVPGVSTPQVIMEKLVEDARRGTLDKQELGRVARQLTREQQEELFKGIREAIQSRLPANVRSEIRKTETPQVAYNGQTYTEKDLLGYKKDLTKEIAGMEKGTAQELRAAAKEVQQQGDIWRQVKERGGIRPHAGGDLAEEYRNVPLGLRNKNGLPLDEMADELGMTSNELLEALANRKPLAVPKMSDAIKEAEKVLRLDEDYKMSLRALARIDDLLTKLEPGQVPGELLALLPKITRAEDVLKPEVQAQVKALVGDGKTGGILHTLKGAEKVTLTDAVKAAAKKPAVAKNLSIPVDKSLMVGFEKKAAGEVAQEPTTLTQTLDEMFQAARQAGIKMTPEGRAAAQLAKRVTERTAAKDIAAGVEFGELPNYVRHLYKDTPEKVQQVLTKWMKDRANLPGRKAGFQKERTIPTIAEAKRLGLTPIEDVRILTAVREMEGIKQRGIQKMYDELNKIGANVVRDIKEAPAGWKAMPGIKQLEGKAVHPEVARFLERFNSAVNTDEGIKTLLSVLNGVQAFWKGLVTAPIPAFHIRNAMGNVFNNFLAGVINPEAYRLAVKVQKGGKDVITLGGKRYTAKQLRTMFREQGLEGFGFFAGESTKSYLKQAEEAFEKKPLGKRISPIEAGRKLGDTLETNAKLAHFIDRLNKGDTAAQAAKSVRKYLFDYGDLTQAEKKIRDFIPFYTFTRKNLPLQLENLITNPGKMTALYKLVQNATSAQGVQEGDMPDWMKSELAVPLGGNKSLMLDLPVNQLNMMGGGETLKNALGMLTPLAKVPIELAMGKQIFSGAPIEKYPGAKSRYGGLELPATLTYALSQLGAMPRTAADIAGAFMEQQPKDNYIPAAPKQLPVLGSFIRKTDPEREQLLSALDRERQLADFRKYLEEVVGIEVPTTTELKKRGKVFA